MSTVIVERSDPRPLWVRLVLWSGLALLAVLAPPSVLFGLAIGGPDGAFILTFGLLLLVGAIAGTAREVTERRLIRDPIQPRLDRLPDGEQALLLPRATAPTAISSWALVGFAAVLAIGATLAAGHGSWGLAAVLVLVAGWLGFVAAPHRTASMAGGLWLSPTRIVDEYRGIRWEVPWQDVRGVDATRTLLVLVPVPRDRVPPIERTGPRGRAYKPIIAGNVLRIDTSHVAGGSAYVGQLIERALTEPDFRTTLGTPA